MKTQIGRCDSRWIEMFLLGEMDRVQQIEFETHLDECLECCAALHTSAADAVDWSDARLLLSLDDGSPVPTRVALDFLSPTDDPRMLGRLAGYEIAGVIGQGGMGFVLKGLDVSLNRYVALKVLLPHYASSSAARMRFAREAQAATAVEHDNVIAIHGVGEFEGLPFLVMPYVGGESLQRRIDRVGSLSLVEVLRVMLQIAEGLSSAHAQGLVHRDIKPANKLLPQSVERIVITDFGLARAADDASLTRSGVIAGTPQFMSPEQARGESIDARSDLFSLGSLVYAMCTGEAPFVSATPYGVLRRINEDELPPVSGLNKEFPVWFDTLMGLLHAKHPSRRFASANELASVLSQCLAHVQTVSAPLPVVLKCMNRRKRRLLGVAVCVALVIVACAGLAAYPKAPSKTEAIRSSGPVSSDATAASDSDWEMSVSVSPAILEAETRRIAEDVDRYFLNNDE